MLWRRINRWVSSAWYSGLFDSAKQIERRHVARRLVDAAKQNRDVLEFHAGTPLVPLEWLLPPDKRSGCRNRTGIQPSGHVGFSRERIG